MAQVLLRDYVDKMREHLRTGQYSDATALGHHILRYYPKHLETYRLLAEISLETDDLSSAADLFQRVRSADPENVVALLGLAIVHERRKELSEAVWHLERAFEIQPTNAELRQELQRLYAESEGKPRPRLKLTPGGLARLYARQGLYPQAIQELRSLLRAAPTRVDLQVALAETLYREGRKREAAEVSQALLDKLPYCLKANLILGAIWAENEVPEAEALLQRAQALDPERVLARDFQVDHWEQTSPPTVPDAREGLATAGLTLDLGTGPARDLFGLEDQTLLTPPPPLEPEPTPLSGLSEDKPSEPPSSTDVPAQAAETAAPAGEPPEARDKPQGQAEKPAAPEQASPGASRPLPINPAVPQIGPRISGALEKLPAWLWAALRKTVPAPTPVQAPHKPEPPRVTSEPPKPEVPLAAPAEEAEQTDWLTRLRQAAKRGEEEPSGGAEAQLQAAPPWLIDSDQTAAPSTESAIPNWLEVESSRVEPAVPASPEAELPDWLTITEEDKQAQAPALEELAGQELPKSQAEPETPTSDLLIAKPGTTPIQEPPDGDLGWLEGLTEASGKAPTSVAPEPETSVPTWLEGLTEASGEAPASVEAEPETSVPTWLEGLPEGTQFEPPVASSPEAALSDWLEGLPGSTEFETPAASSSEPAPSDWLEGLPDDSQFETPLAPSREAPVSSWLEGLDQDQGQVDEPTSSSSDAAVPIWLEGLDQDQSDELASSSPDTAVPNWLEGLDQEQGEDNGFAATPPKAAVPSWLEGFEQEPSEAFQTAPVPSETGSTGMAKVPDWLTSGATIEDAPAEIASNTDISAAAEQTLTGPAPTEAISASPDETNKPTAAPEIPNVGPASVEPTVPAQQAAGVDKSVAQTDVEVTPPALEEPAPQPSMAQPPAPEPPAAPQVEPGNAHAPIEGSATTESPVQEPSRPRAVDPETLLTQARELRANGNFVAAIDTYEKVLQRGPRLIPTVIVELEELAVEQSAPLSAHRLLGDAYSMAGRFKEALEQYRIVLGR